MRPLSMVMLSLILVGVFTSQDFFAQEIKGVGPMEKELLLQLQNQLKHLET